MNQFSGLLVTALSVLAAAIVSGLRLKPYIDAGATYTPASFMLYPVLITIALTVPIVLVLRKVQNKKDLDIGPVTFQDRMPFVAFGCIIYTIIALTFFYEKDPVIPARSFSPPSEQPAPADPSKQPLNISFPASSSLLQRDNW